MENINKWQLKSSGNSERLISSYGSCTNLHPGCTSVRATKWVCY